MVTVSIGQTELSPERILPIMLSAAHTSEKAYVSGGRITLRSGNVKSTICRGRKIYLVLVIKRWFKSFS